MQGTRDKFFFMAVYKYCDIDKQYWLSHVGFEFLIEDL